MSGVWDEVARVTGPWSSRTTPTTMTAVKTGIHWVSLGGGMTIRQASASKVVPLVLIDPEDAEQMDRLDRCIRLTGPISLAPALLSKALREFARPNIVEPTARYAAVVNSKGEEWIKDKNGNWFRTSPDWKYATWDEIQAVRILSRGADQ